MNFQTHGALKFRTIEILNIKVDAEIFELKSGL